MEKEKTKWIEPETQTEKMTSFLSQAFNNLEGAFGRGGKEFLEAIDLETEDLIEWFHPAKTKDELRELLKQEFHRYDPEQPKIAASVERLISTLGLDN